MVYNDDDLLWLEGDEEDKGSDIKPHRYHHLTPTPDSMKPYTKLTKATREDLLTKRMGPQYNWINNREVYESTPRPGHMTATCSKLHPTVSKLSCRRQKQDLSGTWTRNLIAEQRSDRVR